MNTTESKVTIENPFLSDIIANREDDTPRLAYADWLLDIYGDRYSARAEFIRVQVELAHTCPTTEYGKADHKGGFDNATCPNPRHDTLRRREGELLVENWSKWFLSDLFPMYSIGCKNLIGGHSADILWTFHRGFVEWLILSWEAFVGGECRRCEGLGGFLGTMQDDTCTQCGGSGRTPSVHRDLIWWPGAVDVCGRCGLHRVLNPNLKNPRDVSRCSLCSGTGTVPRSCPPTAQPIRVVTLDSIPNNEGFWVEDDKRKKDYGSVGYVENMRELHFYNDRWPTITFKYQSSRAHAQ